MKDSSIGRRKLKALGATLAAGVNVHVDGGGKWPAAMQPIAAVDVVRNPDKLKHLHQIPRGKSA